MHIWQLTVYPFQPPCFQSSQSHLLSLSSRRPFERSLGSFHCNLSVKLHNTLLGRTATFPSMSSPFDPNSTSAPGSGGKVFRARRFTASTFPYRRPTPKHRNPSFDSGWLFSAARSIAAGAGKLFSVLRPDSGSSSCDNNSSDFDSSSDEYDRHSQHDGQQSPAEMEGNLVIAVHIDVQNGVVSVANATAKGTGTQHGETKCVIEKLLLQETYTWEECSKLTKIIQSRVVDKPSKIEDKTASSNGPGSKIGLAAAMLSGNQELQLETSTVMEAKKWLQEKRLDRTPKRNGGDGHGSLEANITLPDVEMDSPILVAQSYMKSKSSIGSPFWVEHASRCSSAGLYKYNQRGSTFESCLDSAFDETRRTGFDVCIPVEPSPRVQEGSHASLGSDEAEKLARLSYLEAQLAARSTNAQIDGDHNFLDGTSCPQEDILGPHVLAGAADAIQNALPQSGCSVIHKASCSLQSQNLSPGLAVPFPKVNQDITNNWSSKDQAAVMPESHGPLPKHDGGTPRSSSASKVPVEDTEMKQNKQLGKRKPSQAHDAPTPISDGQDPAAVHVKACLHVGKRQRGETDVYEFSKQADHLEVVIQPGETDVYESGIADTRSDGGVGLESEKTEHAGKNQNVGDLKSSRSETTRKVVHSQNNSSIKTDAGHRVDLRRSSPRLQPNVPKARGGHSRISGKRTK